MTVGTFTAASAASDVPSKEWTVGNYYYLKTTDDSYLALDGTKADSVIVKKFVSSDVTKAAMTQLYGRFLISRLLWVSLLIN